MTVINENYSFEREASPVVREAFVFPPQKKLFPANTEFCRIITTENKKTGDTGNHTFGSPWWFTKDTFRKIVARSDTKGLGISSVARIDLAISHEFNPQMDWICVMYLTHAAYGWVGKAARQLAVPGANIYWGGGAEQVFLPNLATRGNPTSSEWARMRYFGMVPDYF